MDMQILEGLLRRLQQLERRVELLSVAEAGGGWLPLPYVTGWVDFGSPYAIGEYKRVGDIVLLSGAVKRTSGSSTTIATMPTDCRPAQTHVIDTISGGAISRLDIGSSGNLVMTAGVVTYIALSGLYYKL